MNGSIYMRDDISIVRPTGADKWGVPSIETIPIKARVVWKTKLVVGSNSENVLAAGYVELREPVTHADNLLIEGKNRVIVSIEEKKSFAKSCGWRVYFQ